MSVKHIHYHPHRHHHQHQSDPHGHHHHHHLKHHYHYHHQLEQHHHQHLEHHPHQAGHSRYGWISLEPENPSLSFTRFLILILMMMTMTKVLVMRMMTIFQDIASSCSEKEFSVDIASSSGGHQNNEDNTYGHDNHSDDHAQFGHIPSISVILIGFAFTFVIHHSYLLSN